MPSQYFENYGVISLTAASTTITDEGFVGSRLVFNRAAGATAILPAATGSGNRYEFIVATTFTGEATIKVANANDVMQGTATLFADAGDTLVGFATAASSDTITFTSTNTTGGIAGARVILTDVKANTWNVWIISDAAGTEATPFSATV